MMILYIIIRMRNLYIIHIYVHIINNLKKLDILVHCVYPRREGYRIIYIYIYIKFIAYVYNLITIQKFNLYQFFDTNCVSFIQHVSTI